MKFAILSRFSSPSESDLVLESEATTIPQIAKTMDRTGIQRIPIVNEGGKLVGLITQSVVIRSFIANAKPEH